MKKIMLLLVLWMLLGCDGDETAVSSTAPTIETGTSPTLSATAVAATPQSTNTPATNDTAVSPPPLSMETVVAQTRTAEADSWVLRVNHLAGIQFMLPAKWEQRLQGSFRYAGRDGSLNLTAYWNESIATLPEACASDEVAVFLNVAGYEREMTTVNGRDVCLYRNSLKETVPYALVQYPTPWPRLFPTEGPYQFLLLFSASPTVTVLDVLETLEFPETPDAAAYLRGVVDEYQGRYVFRDQVDFAAWEADALARLSPDGTLMEAHQLIFELFDLMRTSTGHDHLAFYSPERVQSLLLSSNRQRLGLLFDADDIVWLVEPDGPAAAAGFQVGDRLVTLNGVPLRQATLLDGENELAFERNGRLQTVTVSQVNYSNLLPPNGRLLTDNIAYLETFGFNNQVEAELNRYITLVHDQIAELDAPGRCWLLDLRRNRGGSKHALQGGIGPFAGNGPLYAEWLDAYDSFPVMYENGRIYSDQFPDRDIVPERPYTMIDTGHRIAILVSELTASGGELSTLIVSTQRENMARIFGEPTAGLSSSVEFLELYDKAMVHLPLTTWADLEGNLYPEGIIPDEPLEVVFDARYGTLDDPVVQTAVAWLEDEQGCR